MFFDTAKINVKGGDGGDGCMAMRRVTLSSHFISLLSTSLFSFKFLLSKRITRVSWTCYTRRSFDSNLEAHVEAMEAMGETCILSVTKA